MRAEVVGAHGRWLPCYESRVPDECRGQWDSECLQRVGALNDIDYGLRLRGQWQGNLGHWTVWLYDLREGELVSMEERECARPCTEFRAESTYRDVHRVVLEAIVRD